MATLYYLPINGYHVATPSSKGGDNGERERSREGTIGREECPEPMV